MPHPYGSQRVLVPSGQTWSGPELGTEDHDRQPHKGRSVLPHSRDWGSSTALWFRVRYLWFREYDTNATIVIFRGVLVEGSYPLARRLLRAWMIREIVRCQAPIKLYINNFILLNEIFILLNEIFILLNEIFILLNEIFIQMANNCQLKLFKCYILRFTIIQIASLSFVLQIWDCHFVALMQ